MNKKSNTNKITKSMWWVERYLIHISWTLICACPKTIVCWQNRGCSTTWKSLLPWLNHIVNLNSSKRCCQIWIHWIMEKLTICVSKSAQRKCIVRRCIQSRRNLMRVKFQNYALKHVWAYCGRWEKKVNSANLTQSKLSLMVLNKKKSIITHNETHGF